jgi:hypothetical protein
MDFNEPGEKVLDFILALGLVGRYFYSSGQYALAHHECNGTTKLTLSDFFSNSDFFVNSCHASSHVVRPQPYPSDRLKLLR